MLTDTELIRKLDFFEPLDQKIIKHIAELCIVREFAAGDAIVRQGESGLGLYFITRGHAKVEIEREGGKLVVAELKEGDFLGEFSLIDDKTRSASVICLQDTRCLLLTRDSFAKLLRKYPEIATQMLRTLVGRIRNTNERIAQPSGARPAAAPPSAPAAPEAPAAASPENGAGRISELTSQIVEMIPRPEDVMQFYSSTKNKTQEYLSRFVSAIYAMKAMLRFSMAIVGCPVTVAAEQPGEEVLAASLNGVKVVMFPTDQEQTLRIEADDDGHLSATLYRSIEVAGTSQPEVFHLRGTIGRGEVLRLHVLPGQPIRLEHSGAPSLRLEHDEAGLPPSPEP